MSRLSFFVPGLPQPKGSLRAFTRRGGRGVGVEEGNAARLRPWMQAVAWAAREAGARELLGGPLLLRVVFCLARPRGHFGTGKNSGRLRPSAPRFPDVKPDWDKLARAVCDALTGVVWRDDAQVVTASVKKVYLDDIGAGPGARVKIGTPAQEGTR